MTIPDLSTTDISNITNVTASSGGIINKDGGSEIISRGICWSTSPYPTTSDSSTTDGTGTGEFTSSITGLRPKTTYYVWAYATNSVGTSFGNQISFTTSDYINAPSVTTYSITNQTITSAICGGNVTEDGGATVTSRGVCWSTSQYPTTSDPKSTDGTGTGVFTSKIIVYSPNTTYYVRAYATNTAGTGYGNQMSFTTLNQTMTVTDADGNVYNLVVIGAQIWLKENLKVTKFKDGQAIPLVTDNTAWGKKAYGYCWYNNDGVTYKNAYGALYNWYTVNSGKLCPEGWHVPSTSEWWTMTTFLGGEGIAGGKLKEIGTTHWNSPNTGATNETGFTALPGGMRYNDGMFKFVGLYGYWWSSSEFYPGYAWALNMYSSGTKVDWSSLSKKEEGYSVRCVRD